MANSWLEFHQQQIENFKRGIQMMEAGTLGTGELDAAGNQTDTTAETIARYRRIVSDLEELVTMIKGA